MKTNRTLASLLLGAALCGLGAQAQTDRPQPSDAPRGPGGPPPFLGLFDRDGDGALSESEIADAGQVLRRFDRNGNGRVTADEFRFRLNVRSDAPSPASADTERPRGPGRDRRVESDSGPRAQVTGPRRGPESPAAASPEGKQRPGPRAGLRRAPGPEAGAQDAAPAWRGGAGERSGVGQGVRRRDRQAWDGPAQPPAWQGRGPRGGLGFGPRGPGVGPGPGATRGQAWNQAQGPGRGWGRGPQAQAPGRGPAWRGPAWRGPERGPGRAGWGICPKCGRPLPPRGAFPGPRGPRA